MVIAKHRKLSGKARCHKGFWGDILSSGERTWKTALAAEGRVGWDGGIGLRACMWRWSLGNCRWILETACIRVLLRDEGNEMEHSLWNALAAAWLEELGAPSGGHRAQAAGY